MWGSAECRGSRRSGVFSHVKAFMNKWYWSDPNLWLVIGVSPLRGHFVNDEPAIA